MLIKVESDKSKKYEIDKIFEDYIPYHIIYNEIINNCIKECLKGIFIFIKKIMMNIVMYFSKIIEKKIKNIENISIQLNCKRFDIKLIGIDLFCCFLKLKNLRVIHFILYKNLI